MPVVCKSAPESRKARTAKRHLSIRKKVGHRLPGGRVVQVQSQCKAVPVLSLQRANAALSITQVSGTTERPRLAVYRSNQHIYAQVRRAARSERWHAWSGGPADHWQRRRRTRIPGRVTL